MYFCLTHTHLAAGQCNYADDDADAPCDNICSKHYTILYNLVAPIHFVINFIFLFSYTIFGQRKLITFVVRRACDMISNIIHNITQRF